MMLQGIDQDVQDADGRTALILAAGKDNLEASTHAVCMLVGVAWMCACVSG